MKRWGFWAIACLLVLAVGPACGAGEEPADSGQQKRDVRLAVLGLYAALEAGEVSRACGRLTSEARSAIGSLGVDRRRPPTCAAQIGALLDSASGEAFAGEVTVDGVTVHDEASASAKVSVGARPIVIPLSYERGRWLVASLGG